MSVSSTKHIEGNVGFQIPNKLYGRTSQLDSLLTSFQKIIEGDTEVVLIKGYSGTGKSSLIDAFESRLEFEDLSRRIARRKCDKLQRNIPYYPVIQAFEAIIRDILENTSKVERLVWEKSLQKAMDRTGKILTDIIPSLEQLIGTQPDVPHINGREATYRFHFAFERLVSVFATKHHPLILFIDDLQWIDEASMMLLKSMVLDNEVNYFMFIGAIRGEEKYLNQHQKIIKDIEEDGEVYTKKKVLKIDVENITAAEVNQLVADSLKISTEESKEIGHLIHQKTKGNPFFVRQLLLKLYNNGLITFDNYRLIWFWDIEEIKQINFTEDVLDLMIDNLKELTASTQEMLKIASCIGRRFDLAMLKTIYHRIYTDTYDTAFNATYFHLEKAINEGILLKEGESYHFVHDRVHQAVNSLNSKGFKKKVHLHIGRLLFSQLHRKYKIENLASAENIPAEDVFITLNHWNKGIAFINSKVEKSQLGLLNLTAGIKSTRIAAKEAALKYFEAGIDLIYDDSWRRDYDLTLALHTQIMEAEYMNGDFGKFQARLDNIVKNVKTPVDAVEAYESAIQAYSTHHHFDKALDLGFKYLNDLGLNLDIKINKLQTLKALARMQWLMLGKSPARLLKAPPMKNKEAMAILRIMRAISVSVYFSKSEILPYFTMKGIEASLKYGNSADAIIPFGGYALMQSIVFKNYKKAYQFGEFQTAMIAKYNGVQQQPYADLIRYSFLHHGHQNIKKALENVHQSYGKSIETGNLSYTFYIAFTSGYFHFFAGEPLSKVLRLMEKYAKKIEALRLQISFPHLALYMETYQKIHEPASKNATRKYKYDEALMTELSKNKNDAPVLFGYYFNQMMYAFLLRDNEAAYQYALQADKYSYSSLGSYVLRMFYFYWGLVIAQLLGKDSTTIAFNRSRVKSKLQKYTQLFQQWGNQVHENYLHKYKLLDAETKRINNDVKKAAVLYEEAILLAEKEDFINEVAIIRELTAEFYYSIDNPTKAMENMKKAIEAYRRWEAFAKVEELEKRLEKWS